MRLKMLITGFDRILLLVLCVGVSLEWAASIRGAACGAIRAIDFGALYYGARCALEHRDPYNPRAVLGEFSADGGRISEGDRRGEEVDRTVVTEVIYLPTALFVVVPFASLKWPVASVVWMALVAGLLVVAAFLAWNLSGRRAVIAGCLACFMLANCVMLLTCGNPVGVVVPFCVIAAWCLLEGRYARVGVALLALSLVLKPHDAGFVWLYFLLAGGMHRRRALQALVIAGVIGVCAAIWIAPSSPHWIAELHRNLKMVSARGSTSDPGPYGLTSGSFVSVLSLQSSLSIFKDDPHFYNPVGYIVGGSLVLLWAIAVLRRRISRNGALLAFGAISCLSLLPVYHRPYDAKLLLLMLPACTIVWGRGGVGRWIALVLTSLAIFFTSDLPLMYWVALTKPLRLSTATPPERLALLLSEPAPLVLLAAGCFYLWAYVRYEPPVHAAKPEDAGMKLAGSEAT